MKAGKLRQLIEIERLVVTQDASDGAVSETWELFAHAWASVLPLSGREFIAAQAVQAGVDTRITMRHRNGVLPSMRVNHNGTLYNIRAVLPDSTLVRQIVLLCDTGVNDG